MFSKVFSKKPMQESKPNPEGRGCFPDTFYYLISYVFPNFHIYTCPLNLRQKPTKPFRGWQKIGPGYPSGPGGPGDPAGPEHEQQLGAGIAVA